MPAYCIEDYVNLPSPDTIWVWKGILPTSGAALLFGDPKLGKSFLALGLAEAIADPSIDSYLGQTVQQHGPVLYIQLDTPRSLWKSGYISSVKSPVARKNIYIIDKELPDRPNPFDIREARCQEWVRREVDIIEPVMTIVDTVRRMHRGDENDPTVMALVYDTFVNITQPSSMMLITHKKKHQQGEPGLGAARGSTVIMGAVDALINMTKSALHLEARSDVEEEIPIYQHDDGTFRLNSKESEIKDFLLDIKDHTESEQAKALVGEFKVSLRTAQRWRKSFGHK